MQTDLGVDFFWDVRKLWTVDLPVVSMRVRDLEWLLDKPFWKDGPRKLTLRPLDVATHPQRHQADYERTMAVDLSRPINVIEHRGRWVVIDGLHRLLKAWMCGHEMILAKQAHEKHIPLFSRRPTDPSNHP